MRGGHNLDLTSMTSATHHSFRLLRRGIAFSLPHLRRPPFHRKVAVFNPKVALPTIPWPRLSVCSATVGARQREWVEAEETPEVEARPELLFDAELRPPPGEVEVKVRELEDLPDQWRRSRLAWLCKELPAHKPATVIRLLNGQRKWMDQEGATYVAVHCMRIRENDTSFRVYKWMLQQHWFQFDFALATKLADYLGKDRKFAKCRELFDQIINQGLIPCESTFHILIVAYLSAPVQGCLEEACTIYNRMIQLGGYKPRLSLHNSLFRAIVSKPGGTSKYYLNQAELIFQNIVTDKLEIHKEIFGGLIWLHSYQDFVDKERVASLWLEMQKRGIEESPDVLVSLLRVCAKEGNVEEAEKTWKKLRNIVDVKIPSQAFVYRMEVYAKAGEPRKSFEIFEEMKEMVRNPSLVSYHKIIEIMSRVNEVATVEALMDEFIGSGLKPILPSFVDLMNMYFKMGMHDKVELAYSQCISNGRPNQSVCSIYMDSLIILGNVTKAEEIFNEMNANEEIGVGGKSCNLMLGAFLCAGENSKAEYIYNMMCRKKYEIDASLVEKINGILTSKSEAVKKPISLKLGKEQREILMGLLLGGTKMVTGEGKSHYVAFEFKENSDVHSLLRLHVHEKYCEWLDSTIRSNAENAVMPYLFSTVVHPSFDFYADQFWPKGRLAIPKLIHRWLSARVLAYWYMYGGLRTSKGDIVLKLKSDSRQDVENIVKTFKSKSLNSKIKMKDKIHWIGFQGSDAVWFWKLVEPYILEELKDFLRTDGMLSTDEKREDLQTIYGPEFGSEGE